MLEGGGSSEKRYIGRSRGGLTAKVHTRTNAEGLAVGFTVTPGKATNMSAYGELMDEDAPDPVALLADKGYDSEPIRDGLEGRASSLSSRPTRHKIQRPVPRETYAHRKAHTPGDLRRTGRRRDRGQPPDNRPDNAIGRYVVAFAQERLELGKPFQILINLGCLHHPT